MNLSASLGPARLQLLHPCTVASVFQARSWTRRSLSWWSRQHLCTLLPLYHQRAEHNTAFSSRVPEHFVCCSLLRFFLFISPSLKKKSPLFRVGFKNIRWLVKQQWHGLDCSLVHMMKLLAACTYQQWGWCECVISDYVCSTDFFFFSAGCLKLSIAIQLYMTQK